MAENVLGRLDQRVDLGAVLADLVDDAAARLGADRATVYLVDHARDELVSRVAHLPEIAEIRLRLGEGLAGWVARTGELVNVPGGAHDERFAGRFDALTGYRTRSVLAAPIRDGDGTVIGVVQVLNKRAAAATRPTGEEPRFDAADERAIATVAEAVAHALGGTSLRSQLRPGQRHPLSIRFNHIVGESPPMLEAYDRTARAARTDATVLLRGPSGSGKELFARAIHENSARHAAPFVKVDCGALPGALLENELFGHERGAFTGADRAAEGKVHAARGGTLFLDEIGELSASAQARLLRLTQDRSFFRVGGTKAEGADVRFVCATWRDLEADVAAGRFRSDLYWRLRVVEIVLPNLRARGPSDLDRLIDHLLFEAARRHHRPGITLSDAARARLHAHDWPGNVRELEHAIESAVVLAPTERIQPDGVSLAPPHADPDRFTTSLRTFDEVERDYLAWALQRHGGNRSATARALGIGRNTLARKLGGDGAGDEPDDPA